MANRADSSGLSVISEEKASARKAVDAGGDYECTSYHKIKSAYGGGSKKKLHPLMTGPTRQNPGKIMSLHSASKNNFSEFTQRIMSAKLLRVKQVQNQLSETQIQLNELINENRILRNMQKRQEGALRRYEGNHAELPQLIRSHNEEIRTLKANNKLIKTQLRESNAKLKERENELEALRDNYSKLKKLSTEKNLLEREKLQKKVEDLQDTVKEQEEKIQVLTRKILLESKNYRHHLNVEVMKHKETQKDLNSALTMITKLESQLLAKDKTLPGGKVLLKRENKTVMPILANKSMDIQPKMGLSEGSFGDGGRKSRLSDSQESELEILNAMASSDDTPSPTQDIFPDIGKAKQIFSKTEIMTERNLSKSNLLQTHLDLSADQSSISNRKKTPAAKVNHMYSPADIEANAKLYTGKISKSIEAIDNISKKLEKCSAGKEKKNLLGSLNNEQLEKSAKLESDKSRRCSSQEEVFDERDDREALEFDIKRTLAKRKFDDQKKQLLLPQSNEPINFQEDLNLVEQQKLESMTKTWNDMKQKIQEERKKAEEKLKELNKINGGSHDSDPNTSDSDVEKFQNSLAPDTNSMSVEEKKELKFVNFTNDVYILQELEKTDKIFNKLKNENKKIQQKNDSEKKSKANLTQQHKQKQQNIKSFRTESRRDPKFLEEFQSEYQKQNLIKALKAIDNEREMNFSTDESGDSEREQKEEKFSTKNGLKSKVPVDKSNKDLLTELFGTKNKLGKTDIKKFECSSVAGMNK